MAFDWDPFNPELLVTVAEALRREIERCDHEMR